MNNGYKNFKMFMELKGITVEELAVLLGRSTKTVQNKLDGKGDFTFKETIKICEEYNISADFFVGSDETPGYYELTYVMSDKILWLEIDGKFHVNPPHEKSFLALHPFHSRVDEDTHKKLEAAPGQEISL